MTTSNCVYRLGSFAIPSLRFFLTLARGHKFSCGYLDFQYQWRIKDKKTDRYFVRLRVLGDDGLPFLSRDERILAIPDGIGLIQTETLV